MEYQSMRRKSINIGRTSISYFVAGDETGEPVVLLHGGGTDHALLSWRETIPRLAEAGYYVVAPDHPGYGHTPLPPFPATVSNLVACFISFVELLNLQRPALVGVSMGGAIALEYTLARPSNVRRLVLVGSYGIQDRAPFHAGSYFLVRLPLVNAVGNRLVAANRWLLQQSVRQIIRRPASVTDELLDDVREAMRNRASEKAFSQFQRDEIQWGRNRTNLTPRLPEIEQPVLLIHGSEDIGVPPAAAKRAASLLPRGRLELFEGAGHWTQRDEPDRFHDLLLQFLK